MRAFLDLKPVKELGLLVTDCMRQKFMIRFMLLELEGTKPLGDTLRFIADPEELVFPITGFDEAFLMS